MSTSDYVILDLDNHEVYDKRTGQFVKNVTDNCLYGGVQRRRKGRTNYVPSKHCEQRLTTLHVADVQEKRRLEIHCLLKVVSDSGAAKLHGRPYVGIAFRD